MALGRLQKKSGVVFAVITAIVISSIVSLTTAQTSTPPSTTRATSQPATQSSADPSPDLAIIRFGDRRLASDGGGAFSPDGSLFITRGGQVWNTRTGLPVVKIQQPYGITFIATFLDSDNLFSSAWDNAQQKNILTLSDVKNGNTLRHFPASDHTVNFEELVTAPDGNRVVIAGEDYWLVNPRTGETIRDLGRVSTQKFGHPQLVTPRVQFCCDGKVLMLIDADLKTRWFDGQTGLPIQRREFQTTHGATVSADGELIVVAEQGLAMYQTGSGEKVEFPELSADQRDLHMPGPVGLVAFAPVGKQLAMLVGQNGFRLTIWDFSVTPATIHSGPVRPVYSPRLAWCSDGRKIAVISANRPQLFEASSCLPTCPESTHRGQIYAVLCSPDGHSLITSDLTGGTARWDIATGNRLAFSNEAGLVSMAGAMRLIDKGTTLLGIDRNEVVFCDPTTLVRKRRIATHAPTIGTMALSPDGKLAVQLDAQHHARVWRLDTAADVLRITDNPPVNGAMAFTSDSGTLAICGAGNLHLYSLPGGKQRVIKCNPGNGESRIRCTLDDRLLAVGDYDKIWIYSRAAIDAGDQSPLRVIESQPSDVRRVTGVIQFSTVGGLLAVGETLRSDVPPGAGSNIYCIDLFEPDSGKQVMSIDTVPERIFDLCFVEHKPLIVTAGNGTALMWDLHAALRDTELEKESDAALWSLVGDNDPQAAYKAGIILDDRRKLASFAGKLSPLIDPSLATGQYQKWVLDLASKDRAVREAAHKRLEAAGPPAATVVRHALDAQEEGETHDRLADILRLIDVAPQKDTGDSIKGALLTRRVLQLLDWSSDPAAEAATARLWVSPATQAAK